MGFVANCSWANSLEKKMFEAAKARETAARTNPWLAQARADVRLKLLDRCSLRHLAPGNVLHIAGDESLGMYGIVDGSLKVYVSADGHGPYFVHVLAAGVWGGEGPAIVRGPRPVTLIAASETKILFLTRPAMLELAAEHPELWEFYSYHLMNHLTVALGAISDLMIRDHEERLMSVLLRLGDCRSSTTPGGSAGRTGPITIHVSQNELAAAANVGRTTANRQLLKLRKAGLVDTAYGRVSLLDPARLRRMLSQNQRA